MNNQNSVTITVSQQKTFNWEDVAELLQAALDGGSRAWLVGVTRYKHDLQSRDVPGITFDSQVPIWPGCGLSITVLNDSRLYFLEQGDLKTGLEIMARDYAEHFRDFETQDDCGSTGDVFLQCCLFGKVVYAQED